MLSLDFKNSYFFSTGKKFKSIIWEFTEHTSITLTSHSSYVHPSTLVPSPKIIIRKNIPSTICIVHKLIGTVKSYTWASFSQFLRTLFYGFLRSCQCLLVPYWYLWSMLLQEAIWYVWSRLLPKIMLRSMVSTATKDQVNVCGLFCLWRSYWFCGQAATGTVVIYVVSIAIQHYVEDCDLSCLWGLFFCLRLILPAEVMMKSMVPCCK